MGIGMKFSWLRQRSLQSGQWRWLLFSRSNNGCAWIGNLRVGSIWGVSGNKGCTEIMEEKSEESGKMKYFILVSLAIGWPAVVFLQEILALASRLH